MESYERAKERLNLSAVLKDLFFGRDLSRSESFELWTHLLNGSATDAQLGAIVAALSSKGETADEIAGATLALLEAEDQFGDRGAGCVQISAASFVSSARVSVQTAGALVLGGAGVKVAQQVTYEVGGRDEQRSLLHALGIRASLSSEAAKQSLEKTGVCFACPYLYDRTRSRLAAIRAQLGVPTILNLIEPLANPALPSFQIIGVWHPEIIKPVARALMALGVWRSWVVHCLDGTDEASPRETTLVAEVDHTRLRTFEISPSEFGLDGSMQGDFRNGDISYNARLIEDVLEGKRGSRARSAILMTAGAGLMVAGFADNPSGAAKLAADAIDSGQARGKLDELAQSHW